MSDLEKETVDTLIKPELDFADELELEDSTDEFNQNQFRGGDEVDLLGDGVPGYQTTGEDGEEDEIAEETHPSPHP
ncbi:hypothetical protein [Legionella jamestowniensis]|uniref:Uncharacterized protein n=1 Tax=Legionella jamestowniensis TaxID=455 RepID=A0A0W0UI78_9GAMM|nr:hypothetical protein [Legionella jamestowniensis]KTD07350.1 hypothetical protein Ljam_1545 [Legionella jamestowniensis]OCH97874.1 hypothetical protein A8135_01225 [Legionella jamestowniensis]SFL94230.1 hypothetical protein SAMN02746073_2666 [Legionella jamestowniensis DSM 19215]